LSSMRIRNRTGTVRTMRQKGVGRRGRAVRDEHGEVVDVSMALIDALDEVYGSITVDDEISAPNEGGRKTVEMGVLVRMAKKSKVMKRFTPKAEEVGACLILVSRGYAASAGSGGFTVTASGMARAKEMNLSLRIGGPSAH